MGNGPAPADDSSQGLREQLKIAVQMAPLPWRYTERMGRPRIECANGNVILEIHDERVIACSDDMKILVKAFNFACAALGAR